MKENSPIEILFLGHSLIEFFDWEGRFPEHQAVNLGVAGETVEGLLARIDGIINDHPNADLIFVMTGANNIAMEDYEFFVPYGEIIDKLKSAYPGAKIYIQSVLPIILEWISGSSIIDINRSIKALAVDKGVEFIDIYSYFVENGEPVKEYLLDDGVHLGDKGYEVWSRVVERIIDKDGRV